MNNKKNYKKGTRKELIYILTSTGLITLNSLHIISPEFNYNTFRLKLEEMAREKIVEKRKYKRGNEQITFYTLADYKKHKKIITEYIPTACTEYYESERDNINRANNANSSRALRKIQESEIMLFMYMTGLASFADQNNGTRYFNSKEIKRYLNYGDDIEEKTDTVLYTKVYGFVSNEFNNYSVYHITKKIPALSSGETKIINIFKMFIKKQYPEVNKAILKSILLAKDINTLIPYIDIQENNKGKTNELIIASYLDKYQEGTYLIPYNDYGKKHVRIMTMPEWDKRMISLYLDHKPNTSGVDIACDDYDKEEKIYTLVFCVPNLNKLKNFYYNAKMINSPGHFKIICFDYQYEFISKLFEEYAVIYEAAFEKYYEKIKEEM